MEFQGTKGEWLIQDQENGVLKDITCPEFSDWFVAQSIGEKDANLILAAPIMLKALEFVVENIGKPSNWDDEILEKAKEAINKALRR